MDTARVDICYRPLRVAWAILSTDREAFREAVRRSHALLGGRFNPIVLVDRPEAKDIVETYRADIVVPLGGHEAVTAFADQYKHLIYPFFPKELVIGDGQQALSHLLDMVNAFNHWHDKPFWKDMAPDIRTFGWDADDPLADMFLMHLGAYPAAEAIGIDYYQALQNAAAPHPVIHIAIPRDQPIPLGTIQHPTIGYLNSHGLYRHYGVQPGWDYSGFYVGDLSNIQDAVNYWNLRASDINVRFLDHNHIARFAITRPEHERLLTASIARLPEHRRRLATWCRAEMEAQARALFPDQPLTLCLLRQESWHGTSLAAPMMTLGEESALGVLGETEGKTRISFAFKEKPFSSQVWFHTQHLVASLDIKVYGRGEGATFDLPYVPELNEVFAREMGVHYSALRTEPERLGVTIDAAASSQDVTAMSNVVLCQKLFETAGMRAQLSGGGLIAQQLIRRMGGVDKTRAFKIGGARRLIRQYGPTHTFSKRSAHQIIGSPDPDGNFKPFADHQNLFIEQRPLNQDLTPPMVFEHLVARGLFRIGAELKCPVCNLPNWYPLDQLRQRNVCDLCGADFDATRALVDTELAYRRTGVLGLEKNAQGAIPVALLLQQLAVNLSSFSRDKILLPSFDLEPIGDIDMVKCETDFVALVIGNRRNGTDIIIGECKDAGGEIDDEDVEKMRKVADALKKTRLNPYILFAKLGRFSPEEIARAKSLNGEFERRVILLPVEQLEPYHIYETKPAGAENLFCGNAEGLGTMTDFVYFVAPAPAPEPPDTVQN